MDLAALWFVIVAVVWTGFFVLEGFDFGVGALHRFVGRDETERRVALNSIGPLWDGNEVWLVVAVSAMFAAFPAWYATWVSALHLAMVIVLVALILRGVSFGYRGRIVSPRWRATWSTTLTIGSVVAPLLIGVVIGDLLAGLPVDADGTVTGTFLDLLTPYGLALGTTLVLLCLWHGAAFLTLTTDGPVRFRAEAVGAWLRWPAVLAVAGMSWWTWSQSGRSLLSLGLALAAPLGALTAAVLVGRRREGLSFTATAVTIGASVASVFAALYPNVLVSSTDPSASLTVAGTASGEYALTVMIWVAVVLLPVVLAYQGWTAYVFRARLHADSGG